MKKLVLVLLLVLFRVCAYAGDRFDFSGYIKNETGLRTKDQNYLQKEKNISEIAGQYKISDELVLFAKVKYFYDFAYTKDKLDKAAHYMEHIQRSEWLRDCYLDFNKGPWFFRLGKQQVAWGQADGIAILDRVNPFDLREYWLPDQVDIRIPLWMLNINYSPKLNSNLQFLFIPDFQESQAAPIGAPFTFRSYTIFDNVMKQFSTSVWDINQHFPGRQFEHSTFGLQWSNRMGDMDYTLNFLYGPYYTARNTTTFIPPPLVLPAGKFIVSRDYKLWRVYGGSFNKTFTNPGLMQGITLRGDFAWYNDEPTYFGDPALGSSKGIVRWDNKFWLVGVDKYVVTKWLLSFQFSQYIMEHRKAKDNSYASYQQFPLNAYTYGAQDPVENIFTLKISTDFLNQRIKPEVLWSTTDDRQGRVSPKVTYEISSNLLFTLGWHYFYGKATESNGQFSHQSQLYTQLKYSF